MQFNGQLKRTLPVCPKLSWEREQGHWLGPPKLMRIPSEVSIILWVARIQFGGNMLAKIDQGEDIFKWLFSGVNWPCDSNNTVYQGPSTRVGRGLNICYPARTPLPQYKTTYKYNLCLYWYLIWYITARLTYCFVLLFLLLRWLRKQAKHYLLHIFIPYFLLQKIGPSYSWHSTRPFVCVPILDACYIMTLDNILSCDNMISNQKL